MKRERILVIGYGNPGRLDDGLGPALAERLAEKAIPGVTVDANYLLTVEDAVRVAAHDVVIFADASVNGPEPLSFRRVTPVATVSFSSHSNQPEAILGLAHELFGGRTRGYVLGIRGYRFDEFGEELSPGARVNLDEAVRTLEAVARAKELDGYLTERKKEKGERRNPKPERLKRQAPAPSSTSGEAGPVRTSSAAHGTRSSSRRSHRESRRPARRDVGP